jgi:iron complex outermembrane recepter protein
MRGLLIAVSIAVATPMVNTVYAADRMMEEVVVSARKRAESLEESPVSVSVFTAEDLESAGIETARDFIALTPNVTLVETQNAGNAFINVRGVSQARNSEMSVAVLVDGVLMANPAQFTQQLFDIQQIEVLRGPQGALYGRNAIGGAITIQTRQPSDELSGRIEVGADSGPGYTAKGFVSGPVGDSTTLKYRASLSYIDTDGFLDNAYLGEKADPYKDISGRLKLLWEPTDNFQADFRISQSNLDTQALYFVIDAEADDTALDIRVNNPGVNERDIFNSSLKLEYAFADGGTFTSISAYDDLEELLTGDNFNFVPPGESLINFFPIGAITASLTGDGFADLSQTQYLESDSVSQEFRYTSPASERLRWIVGTYAIATDRYISTGNQIDRNQGVFPVYKVPRVSLFVDPTNPSPQLSLLADAQDNFAWAVFGDIAYDFTDTFEASLSLRYDRDTRENTTLTEPLYDPTGGIGIVFGEVREETFSELQPKINLRYLPSEDLTIYGGWSRGFRSGGFNQTGVGAAITEPGVEDVFGAQVADTFEAGIKNTFMDGRFSTSLSVYSTDFDNAYFFFYDPTTSTQNLGSIPEVEYVGLELEANAYLNDYLTGYFGLGLTDSKIVKAADPEDNGNEAPLVSKNTVNAGLQLRYPIASMDGVYLTGRIDYQHIGDTYWDPGNISVRSPVDLVDARVGFESEDDWSLVLWTKNAFDEEYNAEFSPGPAPGLNFLWKAPPRRFGLSFIKNF